MPTVEDLGRKAKRKDPHRYGHLSDAEAGRQAKRDYPGYYTQYEDISDSIIKAHQNPLNQNQSVNEINSFGDMINDLMQAMQIPGNDRLEAYNTALDRHLNPNRGWFTAKWQNSKAAARLELAQTIGQERYEVLEQMMRYAERVRQGKMDEIAFKQFIADAAIRLMETQSRANRVIEADRVGIPESEYTPIKVDHFRRETELPLKEKEFQFEFSRKQKEDQHEFDMWLKREKAKLELELQREGGLSDIKIDTKKAEAQIEWKNFKKTKDYAVQASILSNLSEVAEIGYLTQALLTTIETIYEIESLPDAGRYINQLEVFKRNKQKLVDLIDGRFQQLL